MLLPARTDTKAFHDFIYGKAEIRFIKGRLKYGNSGTKGNAPFPSMVVVFRGDRRRKNEPKPRLEQLSMFDGGIE